MCNACKIDTSRTEAFAGELMGILNKGGVALMISIGHRAGLFDTMSQMAPSTSREIAEFAGLNERYVREWLGAMTVGGIVEYDSDQGRYFLPAEHAALLTRAAGGDNMASLMQYIAVLATVEDQVVDCFRKGGGVPYTEYKRFHAVMAEESGQSTVGWLIDHILPLAPGMVEALQAGADVLDIGCGSGRALNLMARTFPNSRFVGYDLSKEALRVAKSEANGNGNIRFELRDLSSFDEDGPTARFDFVTSFDAIHDQARPDRVLRGIHRALRPDGLYLMQDIAGSNRVENNMDHPIGAFIYTISCMHCMTVSLAQGGMGLGAMWGEETAADMLHAAGFRTIEIRRLEQDVLNNYYVASKS